MAMNNILFQIFRDNSRRPVLNAVNTLVNLNCSSYHVAAYRRAPLVQWSKVNPTVFSSQVRSYSSSQRSSSKDARNSDEFLKSLHQRQKKLLLEELDETEPHVIYKGLLSQQMKTLKIFSLTTSGMGILMQPLLIEKSGEIAMAANVAIFGMIGFFTFVTPILIHSIAKKYITEIVYDPKKDSYTATTFTFFLQKKQTEFTMGDLKVPDVPGPFTSITVNRGDGQHAPFFVAPESFLKPAHYGRFMGYDKPIDLHLSTIQNISKESSDSDSKSKN